MAGKPQAEKAVERFPELGCFAVAVRRIVYEKGMTLDNAIKKSGISKSAWFAGMAGSGGKPTRLPSLASFFAIADGLGITPEELIAAMRNKVEKLQIDTINYFDRYNVEGRISKGKKHIAQKGRVINYCCISYSND